MAWTLEEGVEGGLIVLGCLGDEGVDREGPG